jgi:tetratricopeptide (TPR) repeat protein
MPPTFVYGGCVFKRVPPWVWTIVLLLILPLVMALLVVRRPSVDDLVLQSQALAAAGEVDASIAALDAAIQAQPEDARLYVERGQRILLLFEWDRARADFDRAVALDPAYPDAYYYRGVLFASVPDASARPDAIADFQRYLDLAPEGEHADEAARFITQLRG